MLHNSSYYTHAILFCEIILSMSACHHPQQPQQRSPTVSPDIREA